MDGRAPSACRTDALRVRVDEQLTVEVTNVSASTCSLSGAPPVHLVAARTTGTAPVRSAVDLRPGQSFVQPEPLVPGATACERPVSAGPEGFGRLTVLVGDASVAVPPPRGVSVISVVNCGVVAAVAGHVVP